MMPEWELQKTSQGSQSTVQIHSMKAPPRDQWIEQCAKRLMVLQPVLRPRVATLAAKDLWEEEQGVIPLSGGLTLRWFLGGNGHGPLQASVRAPEGPRLGSSQASGVWTSLWCWPSWESWCCQVPREPRRERRAATQLQASYIMEQIPLLDKAEVIGKLASLDGTGLGTGSLTKVRN